jgi:hypothetical protein
MNNYELSRLYMEKRANPYTAAKTLYTMGKAGLPALRKLGPAFKNKSLAQMGSAAKRQLGEAWRGFRGLMGSGRAGARVDKTKQQMADLLRRSAEANKAGNKSVAGELIRQWQALSKANPNLAQRGRDVAAGTAEHVNTLRQNAFGSLALTGAGTGLVYGGAQGLGYGAGLVTGDRSGQRQFDSLQNLRFGDRFQSLFNPQAFAQAQAARLAATQTRPKWTRFVPGLGGLQAGHRAVERGMDRYLTQAIPEMGFGARAGYTFAPEWTLNRLRQGVGW